MFGVRPNTVRKNFCLQGNITRLRVMFGVRPNTVRKYICFSRTGSCRTGKQQFIRLHPIGVCGRARLNTPEPWGRALPGKQQFIAPTPPYPCNPQQNPHFLPNI